MPKEHRLTLPSAPVKQQHENYFLENDSRSIKEAEFFTLGYTGRKIEELIDTMLKANVQSLVDIRKNPMRVCTVQNLARIT
jgi:hypothetical protein